VPTGLSYTLVGPYYLPYTQTSMKRTDGHDDQRVEAPVYSGASASPYLAHVFSFWDDFEDWIESTDSPWVRED
jgi:hypothetical protein